MRGGVEAQPQHGVVISVVPTIQAALVPAAERLRERGDAAVIPGHEDGASAHCVPLLQKAPGQTHHLLGGEACVHLDTVALGHWPKQVRVTAAVGPFGQLAGEEAGGLREPATRAEDPSHVLSAQHTRLGAQLPRRRMLGPRRLLVAMPRQNHVHTARRRNHGAAGPDGQGPPEVLHASAHVASRWGCDRDHCDDDRNRDYYRPTSLPDRLATALAALRLDVRGSAIVQPPVRIGVLHFWPRRRRRRVRERLGHGPGTRC
mmetsp:Transcript_181276/g.575303  ORF Transcript_181276/g.575303 Transcript_181276/m.575303 type:complete len:260 (-) Transcript_181276:21-800(-)